MDRLFPVQQEQLTSDDYYTPRWVFDRMGLRFDVDVCAPPGGVEWVPADRYYDQAADGLAQPWEGRVWMNPPFSDCAPWTRRFVEHRHGVCVVQVSKSKHSAALWQAADAVTFVGGFAFCDAMSAEGQVYMPCWFAAFGDECVDAIGRLGVVRRVA
jgi:hypothetical protein